MYVNEVVHCVKPSFVVLRIGLQPTTRRHRRSIVRPAHGHQRLKPRTPTVPYAQARYCTTFSPFNTASVNAISPVAPERVQLVLGPPVHLLRLPLPAADEADLLAQRLETARDGHLLRDGQRLEAVECIVRLLQRLVRAVHLLAQQRLALQVAAEVQLQLRLQLGAPVCRRDDRVLHGLQHVSHDVLHLLLLLGTTYIECGTHDCLLVALFVIVVAAETEQERTAAAAFKVLLDLLEAWDFRRLRRDRLPSRGQVTVADDIQRRRGPLHLASGLGESGRVVGDELGGFRGNQALGSIADFGCQRDQRRNVDGDWPGQSLAGLPIAAITAGGVLAQLVVRLDDLLLFLGKLELPLDILRLRQRCEALLQLVAYGQLAHLHIAGCGADLRSAVVVEGKAVPRRSHGRLPWPARCRSYGGANVSEFVGNVVFLRRRARCADGRAVVERRIFADEAARRVVLGLSGQIAGTLTHHTHLDDILELAVADLRGRQVECPPLAALLRLSDLLLLTRLHGGLVRRRRTVLVLLPPLAVAVVVAVSFPLVGEVLFPRVERLARALVRDNLVGGIVEARHGLFLKGNVGIVVHLALLPRDDLDVDAGRLELATLLQRGQTARLLLLPLAGLALGLFALRVGETRTRLAQHLLLVLVEIDRVGPRRLALGVRVELAGPQAPHVVGRGGLRLGAVGPRQAQAAGLAGLGLVEELLVALEALVGGAADDGGNGAPLGRHELGEVQELLVLLLAPFDLLDAGVEPFVPSRFALLGRLARQQGRHARPLVEAIFRHGGLEDLILNVGPDASLDDGHFGGGIAE
ncbi:hypothetical protein BN1708_004512 [Verticillium longisporum]|uniref:Uncharacterized protein n=1 Tax=Verticillium longisporum TaxID=100787 RepID=A0A0G4M0P6_VERLO|nr:hypothetical protein BN1708_004512 [Verticillium longisporum]